MSLLRMSLCVGFRMGIGRICPTCWYWRWRGNSTPTVWSSSHCTTADTRRRGQEGEGGTSLGRGRAGKNLTPKTLERKPDSLVTLRCQTLLRKLVMRSMQNGDCRSRTCSQGYLPSKHCERLLSYLYSFRYLRFIP